MKKLLKWVVIIVLIIAIGVLVLGLLLNTIVKGGIETVGPKVTQTPLTLESVDISPFSGKGTLEGLMVGNPDGFETPSSFELGMVKIAIDISSIGSDAIVIEEILVDAAKLTCEMKSLNENNLSTLLANIDKFAGGGAPAKPAETAEHPTEKEEQPAEGGDTMIVIKRFVFTNGEANVTGMSKTMVIPLPEIILTDIGTKSTPVTIVEAIPQIVRPIIRKVFEGMAKEGLGGGDLLESIKGGAILDSVKSGEVLESVTEGTKESGKALLDKAKSILPFGK